MQRPGGVRLLLLAAVHLAELPYWRVCIRITYAPAPALTLPLTPVLSGGAPLLGERGAQQEKLGTLSCSGTAAQCLVGKASQHGCDLVGLGCTFYEGHSPPSNGNGEECNANWCFSSCACASVAESPTDWEPHQGINCWAGNGGTPVQPSDAATPGKSVEECGALCAATEGCHAFTVQSGINVGNCWLRASIDLAQCVGPNTPYDTYVEGEAAATSTSTPSLMSAGTPSLSLCS